MITVGFKRRARGQRLFEALAVDEAMGVGWLA
jgi:hypothetical protein